MVNFSSPFWVWLWYEIICRRKSNEDCLIGLHE
jgi:hypothetical protein